jgi:hypothetical protein
MANQIEIALKAIDQASGVIKQITNETDKLENSTKNSGSAARGAGFSFTELNNAIMIGQQVIQGLKDTYDATIGTFIKYAGEVDSLSNITGESSEETSRLIQVTKLYGVTVEQLTVAQRKLAQEGKSLSEDTLISLAKEYQKLTTGQDRQLFLTKNLGRASSEWGEILNQNTDSLKEQYRTVADGLILTDEEIARAEDLEVSQIILKNNYKLLGIAIGRDYAEPLSKLIREVNIEIEAERLLADGLATSAVGAGEQATAIVDAQNRQAVAMAEVTDSIEEQQAAFDLLSEIYKTEISLMQTLQSEDDNFTKKQSELNDKLSETTQKIEDAIVKFGENSEEVQALQTDYQNLSDEYAQNAVDHENATKKIVYSNLLTKLSVDGISDAEFAMAQQMGVSLGIFTQANANEAIALNTLTTAVANGTISQQEFAVAVNGGASAIQNLVNGLNTIPSEVSSTVTVKTNLIQSLETALNKSSSGSSYGNIYSGRASGGPVYAGQSYWVGENGPEPFIPSTNGTIIPNDKAMGNNDVLITTLRSLPKTIAREIRQLEKYG